MKGLACLCIVLIMFNGCAATGSRPGKYGDSQVLADIFLVSFKSSSDMPKEEIFKNVLRIASEMTLANGFTHFVVMGESDETNSDMAYMTAGYSIPIDKPIINFTIKCFKEGYPRYAIDVKKFLNYNFPQPD